MSQEVQFNNGQQANQKTDISKVFVWNNRFVSGETLLNASGGELTYAPGTLLGRVTASGKLVPHVSTAVDGSENIAGVLAQTITLADTAEGLVSVCVHGDVASDKLVLGGADTLDTDLSGETIKDRLINKGIIPVSGDELTANDNDF